MMTIVLLLFLTNLVIWCLKVGQIKDTERNSGCCPLPKLQKRPRKKKSRPATDTHRLSLRLLVPQSPSSSCLLRHLHPYFFLLKLFFGNRRNKSLYLITFYRYITSEIFYLNHSHFTFFKAAFLDQPADDIDFVDFIFLASTDINRHPVRRIWD